MTMKTTTNSGPQAPRPEIEEASDTGSALVPVSPAETRTLTLTSIGFTGTRRGLSDDQKGALRIFLAPLRPLEVHHGDARGADAEFHQMVRELLPGARIVTHPPQNSRHLAFCEGDEERIERPYLARNKDIVRASRLLIAAPRESVEKLRSGSWSTYRFARKTGVTTLLILPDGRMVFGPMPTQNLPLLRIDG